MFYVHAIDHFSSSFFLKLLLLIKKKCLYTRHILIHYIILNRNRRNRKRLSTFWERNAVSFRWYIYVRILYIAPKYAPMLIPFFSKLEYRYYHLIVFFSIFYFSVYTVEFHVWKWLSLRPRNPNRTSKSFSKTNLCSLPEGPDFSAS